MNKQPDLTRRDFLKVSATVGGGLLITIYVSGCADSGEEATRVLPDASPVPTPSPTPEPEFRLQPGAYVEIDSNNVVTVTVHRTEMGQGVRTAYAMIIAEELEADWSTIQVKTATTDEAGSIQQLTGGSTSIADTFDALLRAGASAREMLVEAAAQTWGVDKSECRAENGTVVHATSDRRLTYGELVEVAAALEPPRTPALKDPEDYSVIGTRLGRVDVPQIVDGSAIYGMDVRLPGMLYAVVARSPVFGGRAASVELDQNALVDIDGVRDIVPIPNGIAVVANTTWEALKGREALQIVWDEGEHAELDSESIRDMFSQQIEQFIAELPDEDTPPATRVEAIYDLPHLAHATMEPMNCVADVRSDACEVWVPTQNPDDARFEAQLLTGLDTNVHTTLMGCGLGRRLETDYVTEAVQISQAVAAPVQLVWTREDDIRHGTFRPASMHWLRGDLDAEGQPIAWNHTIASHVVASSSSGEEGLVRGITRSEFPYSIPSRARRFALPVPVPGGYWRAVFNTQNVFATECFLDEFAEAAGKDPYEMRRELVSDRARAVLDLAADKAGWGTALPDGWGRGIAYYATWGVTPTAQVVEAVVEDDGTVRVQRVVCAVDCGIAINPAMVEAQMVSGIVVGLTAALKGEITIENGRVVQSNFHDYSLLQMDEMPEIEVHIVSSTERPSGVGEMGVPPLAPAVANAVYAATGQRIRRLPIRLDSA